MRLVEEGGKASGGGGGGGGGGGLEVVTVLIKQGVATWIAIEGVHPVNMMAIIIMFSPSHYSLTSQGPEAHQHSHFARHHPHINQPHICL